MRFANDSCRLTLSILNDLRLLHFQIVKEGDIFVDKRVVKAAPYRATNALTCHAKDIFSYEGTDGAED